MKLFSPCVQKLLALLAPVICLTTASAGTLPVTYSGEAYVVDGVNLNDLLQSERFYDNGKGYYWTWTSEQSYKGAYALYQQTGNFNFMGDLKSRIQGTSFSVSAFSELGKDRNSCWYNVASNVLQYWESYYGVFYTGSTPLVYGLTYDKSYMQQLEGTQSLDLNLYFYDNWTKYDSKGAAVGGNAGMAVNWYLKESVNENAGVEGYSQLLTTGNGAFFSNYYAGEKAYSEHIFGNQGKTELVTATDFLRTGMGYNDQMELETYGQIAYVGIHCSLEEGHALTCYGFTLNEENLMDSILVTNSDDIKYTMFQLYVRTGEDGYMHLYEDAAGTKVWDFLNEDWYITDITTINTPQTLKDLYTEYSTGALEWTGVLTTWDAASVGGTETLPTAASGWQVHAVDRDYASFYHSGRKVSFTDSSKTTAVKLVGALETEEVHFSNSEKNYTFNAASGSSLKTDWLHKTGSGTATFNNTAITAGKVEVIMGTLALAGGNLTAGSGEVGMNGTLALNGGRASFTSGLVVDTTGTLAIGASSTLTTNLTLKKDSGMDFFLSSGNKTTQLLTLTGDLEIGEECRFTFNDADLVNGQSYVLMTVSGSVTGVDNIISASGSITLNGNQIVLNYTAPHALTWLGGSNVWDASHWDGQGNTSTDRADVVFAGSAQGSVTVTVNGEVTPLNITVSGGTYTLNRGTNGSLGGSGRVTVESGATLNANISLQNRDIVLHKGATLVYAPSVAEDTIDGITLNTGSHLVLSGSTTFHVIDPAEICGDITLQNNAYVHVSSSLYTEMYGILKGDTGTTLAFSNNSTTQDVTYVVSGERSAFLGKVVIGKDGDSHRTILSSTAATHNITINETGELRLHGTGAITGSIQGTGMLTVDKAATYSIDKSQVLGTGVQLNVAGTATIGTASAGITSALPSAITVSGHLTAYYDAAKDTDKTLEMGNLSLHGGTYTFRHTAKSTASNLSINNLDVSSGGTLEITHNLNLSAENPSRNGWDRTVIDTLSGDGTLNILSATVLTISRVAINGTAGDGYEGGLTIRNEAPETTFSISGNALQYGTTVELGGGTISGKVTMDTQHRSYRLSDGTYGEYGLAALGITGDATIGGLDDTISGSYTYLYSGTFSGTYAYRDESSSSSFSNQIAAAAHTLTINTAENCTFKGMVTGSLSLVKTGRGTQTFSGDTSAFNSGIAVSQGTLVFENAIEKATAVEVTGGTLVLHGGDLAGLRGSDIGAAGTIVLDTPTTGQAYHVDMSGAHGNFTVKIQNSDVVMSGAVASPTISGVGDIVSTTGTSSITVESGYTLALGSTFSNTGTLTLKGAYDVSALKLETGTTTHVNTSGQTGNSGFTMSGGSSVTLVSGGTTIDGGATITHSGAQGQKLVLGRDGKATTSGTVDYTSYLLTGSDTAQVSAIKSTATSHGATLASINMDGGTLTVDTAISGLKATGGKLLLTSAATTLYGTIKDTAVEASAGTIYATMSGSSSLTTYGNVTLGSSMTYTGMTTVTSGTLKLSSGGLKSDITLKGGTLNTGSGLSLASGQDVVMAGGSISGKLTTNSGSTLTLEQNSGISGSLTLNGGTLDLGSYSLSVTGTLTLGQTTTINVASGLSQGTHTLISAASVTGNTSLVQITGCGGQYELLKQDNSLVLNILRENTVTTVYGGNTWANGRNGYQNGDTVKMTNGGTITISGTVTPASVTVSSDKATTWNGSGSLGGTASLTKDGSGTLTINTANSYSGNTIINAGTVSVGNDSALGSGIITMNGGALNINGKQLTNNALLVKGTSSVAAGTDGFVDNMAMEADGVVSGDGELLHADTLTVSGTLSTKNLNLAYGNIKGGSITVLETATVQNGYLGSDLNASTLEKKGSGLIQMSGKNSFIGGITVMGGQLALLEGGSTKGNISVKSGASLLTAQTVNGDIALENGAAMYLRPDATYKLSGHMLSSAGGTLHGSLTTATGSVTELSGTGLAITQNATLSGGNIVYTGTAKLDVQGTLTLAAATGLTGNWTTGTTYTIMHAGSIKNTSGVKDLYSLFNLSNTAYTISSTGKDITLTPKAVKSALARMAAALSASAEPEAADLKLAGEDTAVTEAGGTARGVITDSAVRGIADSIIQADWGVLNAARSFSGTLHRHYATKDLYNSERRSAAWADALGGMTRQSSHGGHAGADSELAGGAVGVESTFGQGSCLFGMGIGYTRNRINTFGQPGLKQDGTQVGIYAAPGVHVHGATYSGELSASYDRTETRGTLGYSREKWDQDSLVLSARLNAANDAGSGVFIGLEYAATSSGRIGDVRTGSAQNLRGELGGRLGKVCGAFSACVEGALTGDMMRHNPATDLGDRYHGANPGRIGGRISAGIGYAISDSWELRASYTFQGAKHNNSHSATIGTTYKF